MEYDLTTRRQRQHIMYEWALRCFPKDEVLSIAQLGLRLLEEAAEAAQSAGVDRELAHRIIDRVFDRPTGLLSQELGGVGVTLLCLAEVAGLGVDECEVVECERVLGLPEEHFKRRNKAKNVAGLTVGGL